MNGIKSGKLWFPFCFRARFYSAVVIFADLEGNPYDHTTKRLVVLAGK